MDINGVFTKELLKLNNIFKAITKNWRSAIESKGYWDIILLIYLEHSIIALHVLLSCGLFLNPEYKISKENDDNIDGLIDLFMETIKLIDDMDLQRFCAQGIVNLYSHYKNEIILNKIIKHKDERVFCESFLSALNRPPAGLITICKNFNLIRKLSTM